MRKKLFETVVSLVLLLCLSACGGETEIPVTETPAPVTTPTPEPAPAPTPTPEPTPTPPPEPLRAKLAVAGDLVMHLGMNEQALRDGGDVYDYKPMFEDVRGYIESADYASCCMETAFCGDGEYVGYPMFRSPDALAYDLADVGFDLIATASNHAMDGWQSGLNRTLDILDDAGLDHVGTYRSQEERDLNGGAHLQEINGIRIAYLDYTYGTNGFPLKDYPYAVNTYYKDYLSYFRDVDYEKVAADLEAAKALEPDFIAVIVHWGAEYMTVPGQAQTDFADWLFAQGVDLVLGGHPHVPQPMELRTVTDENGETRQGFVCYCLGNLLSTMNDDYTYLTAILQLELEKDVVTGETRILQAGYVPAVLLDLYDHGVYDKDWRYRLWDLHAAVADYEAGNDRGVMTDYIYNRLLKYIEDLQNICGAEYDLIVEAAQRG